MAVSAADVKALRERTGAGIMDCKQALGECEGDIEKAIEVLQIKGMAAAAKKAGRIASEGLVHSYIHPGGRVGVLLEVNCETDFVAKTEPFVDFVNDVCLHIAAMRPDYLTLEDIPEETRATHGELFKAQALESGKPDHIVDRIVEGKLRKWAGDTCLLTQTFVKDSDKDIAKLQQEATASIGERISIRRFTRYELGEGLEKRQDDFASEVAAATAG
jgi:elongation factor Ts